MSGSQTGQVPVWNPRRVLAWIAAGTVYAPAAWAGLQLSVFPEPVSPVWPATGVAIAALTVLGLRAWPVVAVGAYLVMVPSLGLAGALLAALGNSMEAIAGAWALQRIGGARAFHTGRGVAGFLGIAATAPIFSTVTGTLAIVDLGGPTPLGEVALTWYVGAAAGALIVTPAIVMALQGARVPRRHRIEAVAFVVSAVAIGMIAFYPWRGEGLAGIRLGFVTVVPLAWAATRFGPLVTSWTVIGLAAAALAGLGAGTVQMMGSPNGVLLQMQALTGLVTVLGLLLAANVQHGSDTIRLLQRNETELQHALDAVRRSERVKTLFLGKAAHEMRTPLTPLRLQVHMLAQRPLDEKQAHSVEMAGRSVARLERLVEELLQAARFESDGLRLAREGVKSAWVVHEAVDQARDAAAVARVTLIATADNSVLYVDRAEIRRVLLHLIENGVKHTPAGGRVGIVAARDGDMVRITVTDGGRGVPVADRAEIFEPFSERGPVSGGEGPGLGLFIVKSLVEAHDGTINVEGEEGEGARFVVRLPAAT